MNYCKYKITSEELVDTLNRTESEINVISEMIDALEDNDDVQDVYHNVNL